MKTGTLLRKQAAAILAVILMISLFAIPAFAEEATTAPATEAATEAVTEAATEAVTGSTESSTDAGTDTNTGSTTDTEDKGLTQEQIISLCILGGLVLVAIVLCIIFHKKVKQFLRVYKSEAGKIAWLPWEQTRKSTWVVLVVLILSALAICLIDFGLSKGFIAFVDLFKA